MQHRWMLVTSLTAVLLVALIIGPSMAQEPEPPAEGDQPQGEASIQAQMGTAFTYQGQLKKDGIPVNGTCDFLFSLWDHPAAGNQIGTNQERTSVRVSNGLFTISDLDFGAGAFNGDARWLKVQVRCPAGSGSWTVLSPRQRLTPAPYALAVPGLWTQQNDMSPNIIGGYSGNTVGAGVVGATIAGGGASTFVNSVSVTGNYATVSGGRLNTAGGPGATVGGGTGNTASSSYATIGGGSDNLANGPYATVPGGFWASAIHYGEMAIASGRFSAAGDAQSSLYIASI